MSAGTHPYEALRERGSDVLIARVPLDDGQTAIFKFWNRPGFNGTMRRLTRTGTAHRECRALQHLERHGMRVPGVYALLRLKVGKARHTDCLVEEDLGVCADTTEFLKTLISSGADEEQSRFEGEILRATRIMVESHLLDTDHRLPNFVVISGGHPVRLDFELAQRVVHRCFHGKQYGMMLGALLGSYVFAVQPDQDRMMRFAEKLVEELQPPKAALQVAGARIKDMLERQRKEIGMDTVFIPPWEKGVGA